MASERDDSKHFKQIELTPLEKAWHESDLQIGDYEEVLKDHRRLVREIDVIISGEEGAAKQASLVDLIGPIRDLMDELAALRSECKQLKEALQRQVQ